MPKFEISETVVRTIEATDELMDFVRSSRAECMSMTDYQVAEFLLNNRLVKPVTEASSNTKVAEVWT